jgi:hypothetical protein
MMTQQHTKAKGIQFMTVFYAFGGFLGKMTDSFFSVFINILFISLKKDSQTRFFTLTFSLKGLSWPQQTCLERILNFVEFSWILCGT